MKTILFTLCFIFTSLTAFAERELTEAETKFIKTEMELLMNCFNKGDIKLTLKKTHPAIYKIAGGEENFKKVVKQTVQQIIDTGIKFESIEFGKPTKFYKAGDELICFTPRSAIMKMDDIRMKSVSFMICIKTAKDEWLYLDGAGLKDNKKLLWRLFPELQKDVELPENSIEIIEGDEG